MTSILPAVTREWWMVPMRLPAGLYLDDRAPRKGPAILTSLARWARPAGVTSPMRFGEPRRRRVIWSGPILEIPEGPSTVEVVLFQSARSAFPALTLVSFLSAGVATGGRVGLFVARVSGGALLILLALWVASRGPMWSGAIPASLGGILATPGSAGKVGALIGALLILILAALGRRTAALRSGRRSYL